VFEMAEGVGKDPQEKFWKSYPLKSVSPYNQKPLHGEVRVRVGREFLKGYA